MIMTVGDDQMGVFVRVEGEAGIMKPRAFKNFFGGIQFSVQRAGAIPQRLLVFVDEVQLSLGIDRHGGHGTFGEKHGWTEVIGMGAIGGLGGPDETGEDEAPQYHPQGLIKGKIIVQHKAVKRGRVAGVAMAWFQLRRVQPMRWAKSA